MKPENSSLRWSRSLGRFINRPDSNSIWRKLPVAGHLGCDWVAKVHGRCGIFCVIALDVTALHSGSNRCVGLVSDYLHDGRRQQYLDSRCSTYRRNASLPRPQRHGSDRRNTIASSSARNSAFAEGEHRSIADYCIRAVVEQLHRLGFPCEQGLDHASPTATCISTVRV